MLSLSILCYMVYLYLLAYIPIAEVRCVFHFSLSLASSELGPHFSYLLCCYRITASQASIWPVSSRVEWEGRFRNSNRSLAVLAFSTNNTTPNFCQTLPFLQSPRIYQSIFISVLCISMCLSARHKREKED